MMVKIKMKDEDEEEQKIDLEEDEVHRQLPHTNEDQDFIRLMIMNLMKKLLRL